MKHAATDADMTMQDYLLSCFLAKWQEATVSAGNKDNDLTPLSAILPGIAEAVKLAQPPKSVTPQSRHHHTVSKQIEELLTIPQGSPEMGFMTRLLTLCSLPRTDPKDLKEYVRRTGPYMFGMTAGIQNRLPYGNLPRLLLAWMCTEAVRTQSRELQLGHSWQRSCGNWACCRTAAEVGPTGRAYGTR